MPSQANKPPTYSKLAQKLEQKLSLREIWNHYNLISQMNSQLYIDYQGFRSDSLFASVEPSVIYQVVRATKCLQIDKKPNPIRSIPFFAALLTNDQDKDKNMRRPFERAQVTFVNSSRIVLVTGIHRHHIDELMTHFYSKYHVRQQPKPTIVLLEANIHWHTIECHSSEQALEVKKFIRTQKIYFDNLQKTDYRVHSKKVRIILESQSDLYAVLVDAMSQKRQLLLQNMLRHQAFVVAAQTSLAYQFKYNDLTVQMIGQPHYNSQSDTLDNQSDLQKQTLPNTTPKDASIRNEDEQDDKSRSDFCSKYSGFSKNSQLSDKNRISDVIETTDQGIQSERSD